MKFIFPYEALMRHKKNLEEMKRKEYFDAKEKVESFKMDIEKKEKKKKKALEDIVQLKQRDGQKINEVQSLEEFSLGQEQLIKKKGVILKELIEKEKKARGIFLEALKDLKILEKLKEKKKEEFRKELRKKEDQEVENALIMGGDNEG